MDWYYYKFLFSFSHFSITPNSINAVDALQNLPHRIPAQRLKQFSLIEKNLKETSPSFKIIKIFTSNYIKLNKDRFLFR